MYNPQLTAFVCAADCGSFTKAAEKLYLSPTAVMKQVNALEAHLQMQLISRTNQGIRLTPAGESVYADAKYLIDYSARAIRRAQQRMSDYEKTFCVGTSILNPCKPFVDLWGKVSDHFPEYRLNIVPFEDEHTTILQEISALGEKFDFLVGVCDSAKWLLHCHFLQLGTYRKCVAVRAGRSACLNSSDSLCGGTHRKMKNTEKLDKTLEKTLTCGYNRNVLFCDRRSNPVEFGLLCVLE